MENFSIILAIITSITSIIINLYTLYIIRKNIGHILNEGVHKVKDEIKKVF